jgi:hypothetical protein
LRARLRDHPIFGVHRLYIEKGDLVVRDDDRVDAAVYLDGQREICRNARIHGQTEALELLPDAAQRGTMHAYRTSQTWPRVSRSRLLADRAMCS